MVAVDLHTHSTASSDGGISPAQYQRLLEKGTLDCIAITDHNRVDLALALHQQFGERIIVGEEIMSSGGEIVGLFLSELVPPGLTPHETMRRVKDQGGIVYIPHPFETMRKGMHPAVMEELVELIDVVEICNGRAFAQNRSSQAVLWATLNQKPGAASSDAHGSRGMGRTYTKLSAVPSADSLVTLLATGIPFTRRPTIRALLYPKYHRLRHKVGGTA